jgi:hypothetical protein
MWALNLMEYREVADYSEAGPELGEDALLRLMTLWSPGCTRPYTSTRWVAFTRSSGLDLYLT